MLQTPESLAKSLALDVRTGQDVTYRSRRPAVEVRDLRDDRTYRESYDKLVLCAGAEPIRPPIPGGDLHITTSWFDCEEGHHGAQPHAGAIFRCRPGVAGRPSPRWTGAAAPPHRALEPTTTREG